MKAQEKISAVIILQRRTVQGDLPSCTAREDLYYPWSVTMIGGPTPLRCPVRYLCVDGFEEFFGISGTRARNVALRLTIGPAARKVAASRDQIFRGKIVLDFWGHVWPARRHRSTFRLFPNESDFLARLTTADYKPGGCRRYDVAVERLRGKRIK
jgi:hypothetical protein